jgi:hypothetical protein
MFLGQGLGNQLACYVSTRCIALDLGYDFGIEHPEQFKGYSFLKNVNFGLPVVGGVTPEEGKPPLKLPQGITNYYAEKNVRHPNGCDISPYDWDLFKISDNTKIDGLMQGEDYFKKHKEDIRKWLKIDLKILPKNLCIINFRGGEYVGIREVFLTKNYWDNAVKNMKNIRSDMIFQVVTDDPITARYFFPGFNIYHDIASDYRSIQSAPYLILSNSSFSFFPAWLNENLKFCIAPRYWSRHNVSDGYWSMDQNYTKGWWYQDRRGNLSLDKDILC